MKKAIDIEKTVDSASNWEDLATTVKNKPFEVDIEKEIEDISKVKKIDFYLWARFAK